MVNIDKEETRHLVIIVDDGHRTVLSMEHVDGLKLLSDITAFYGALNVGEAAPRNPAREDQLAAGKAPGPRKSPGLFLWLWRLMFGGPKR